MTLQLAEPTRVGYKVEEVKKYVFLKKLVKF